MSENQERVTLTIDNHVGVVKFNRPDKMNALDNEQLAAIIKVGKEIDENPEIRAVVLAGEGRAFCAGIDVQAAFASASNGVAALTPRTHGIANDWQQIAWQWHVMQVPVIAAVHGYAYGGGLQIMMGADIRIVAPNTKLSIMEMKWGLIPDLAGTQLFRRTVREDVIKMLTFTNRVFSGEDALKYGFATELSKTPFDDAMALAHDIAGKSPSTIVMAKRVLNDATYLNAEEGLLAESIAQDKLIGSKNQLESVFSQMQKREGQFENYRE
ncbi:MAG: crotonase/enoyl-CoA hydratase family protein [Chloroflexota bacterium]